MLHMAGWCASFRHLKQKRLPHGHAMVFAAPLATNANLHSGAGHDAMFCRDMLSTCKRKCVLRIETIIALRIDSYNYVRHRGVVSHTAIILPSRKHAASFKHISQGTLSLNGRLAPQCTLSLCSCLPHLRRVNELPHLEPRPFLQHGRGG